MGLKKFDIKESKYFDSYFRLKGVSWGNSEVDSFDSQNWRNVKRRVQDYKIRQDHLNKLKRNEKGYLLKKIAKLIKIGTCYTTQNITSLRRSISGNNRFTLQRYSFKPKSSISSKLYSLLRLDRNMGSKILKDFSEALNPFADCQISDFELSSYLSRLDIIEKEIQNKSPNWVLISDNGKFKLYSHSFYPNKTITELPYYYFNPTSRKQTEYIVIGTIEDIKPINFLTVQTNLDIRKTWDKYIKRLDIIHYDLSSKTELINWVVNSILPMQKGCQYAFCRRYEIDNNLSCIICRSYQNIENLKEHISKDCTLVSGYRSFLKVIPKRTIYDKGFDFSMLYYEEIEDDKYSYPVAIISKIVIKSLNAIVQASKEYCKIRSKIN